MYPARTRRNSSILKAKTAFEQKELSQKFWVVGRVVGVLEAGFVLQDESGRADVISNEKLVISSLEVGDIVECLVEKYDVISNEKLAISSLGKFVKKIFSGKTEEPFSLVELQILAKCREEFFIRKEDPSFLKMIIDLRKKDILDLRMEIIKKIRMFFWNEGFVEADTPELVMSPGMEPYLDVFKTRFFADPNKKEAGHDMYLITSPEYAMKKLLVGGYEKIFQIAKSFRNKETSSSLHNPEFAMLEWYRAYASYLEIMDDTERLIKFLAQEILGQERLNFNGRKIDLSGSWTRMKVKDAFLKIAGVPYEDFEDTAKLKRYAQIKGYNVDRSATYEDAFFIIFMNEIEPKLGLDKPVILYEYPASMAALSKKCEGDPKYAERFEVYIAGMELCNAFTELNDPEEQLLRLESERKERQKMGKDDYEVDQRFIRALNFGMPPSGGNALGVDRLVMLLTDTANIQDVLFFPYQDL